MCMLYGCFYIHKTENIPMLRVWLEEFEFGLTGLLAYPLSS